MDLGSGKPVGLPPGSVLSPSTALRFPPARKTSPPSHGRLCLARALGCSSLDPAMQGLSCTAELQPEIFGAPAPEYRSVSSSPTDVALGGRQAQGTAVGLRDRKARAGSWLRRLIRLSPSPHPELNLCWLLGALQEHTPKVVLEEALHVQADEALP